MAALDFEGNSPDFFAASSGWINSHRWQVLLSLVGMLFVGAGIFLLSSNLFEQPKVEILKDTDTADPRQTEQIIVEISGSVEVPGIYKLPKTSRIEDLLIASGGLSKSADREWIEKNVNRAGKLVDGQKIYIPKVGDPTSLSASSGQGSVKGINTTVGEKININSASLKDLDSLPGIGSTRAQAIIDNRPYGVVDELVARKVIPKSVFEKIRENIIAQ